MIFSNSISARASRTNNASDARTKQRSAGKFSEGKFRKKIKATLEN